MMARLISNSNTLLRHASQPSKRVVCHRHRSSEASKWMEIDGVELLEDHIHRITVKKATPDWLPFLPGSSFWVPPPPSPLLHKLFFHKLLIEQGPLLLFISIFDSNLCIYGYVLLSSELHNSSPHSDSSRRRGIEVTVQLKLLTLPENLALSEDDEG
ncbi:hypothetical protein RJT34_32834 [Clitoria ternatea]|uniref:Uncharacterized protein n=1 Tax=Clitoria ternatea TaxID=43366 RepID=A0AAN9F4R3_CLITE